MSDESLRRAIREVKATGRERELILELVADWSDHDRDDLKWALEMANLPTVKLAIWCADLHRAIKDSEGSYGDKHTVQELGRVLRELERRGSPFPGLEVPGE